MSDRTEWEPARSSRSTFRNADLRHLMTDGRIHISGPDTRGHIWRATHVEYDEATNTSIVIRRPITEHDIDRNPDLAVAVQAHVTQAVERENHMRTQRYGKM